MSISIVNSQYSYIVLGLFYNQQTDSELTVCYWI